MGCSHHQQRRTIGKLGIAADLLFRLGPVCLGKRIQFFFGKGTLLEVGRYCRVPLLYQPLRQVLGSRLLQRRNIGNRGCPRRLFGKIPQNRDGGVYRDLRSQMAAKMPVTSMNATARNAAS